MAEEQLSQIILSVDDSAGVDPALRRNRALGGYQFDRRRRRRNPAAHQRRRPGGRPRGSGGLILRARPPGVRPAKRAR
eukprot:4937182-Alexandrium_andersonii.AAC.1